MKIKHVPLRTCIACRHKRNKREMIHLVRENDGSVAVDLSYSKQGRGAYLCPDVNCWEIGIKQNRLEYGLRTRLSSQNRQALLDFSQTLIRKNNFE